MNSKIKRDIVGAGLKKQKNERKPKLLKKFSLTTRKKNQLLAFLKPENFINKTEGHIEKIVDLALKKFEEYGVDINGAAIFPGPTLEKYGIMDKHYGVINALSKGASKLINKEERELVLKTLGISDKKTKILGGHEAHAISGIKGTLEFDKLWLETPSTKIRSGFYVRSMVIKNETVVVVNGFHPHQLAHYTAGGRKLAVLLVASNTEWSTLREKMLGSTFPEKADPNSIRGTLHAKAKDYGFETVRIENNIMHLSAGPTEALFKMDNFLRAFEIDVIGGGAKLASELKKAGLTKDQIRATLTDKDLHSALEHKDTIEAVNLIKEKFTAKA